MKILAWMMTVSSLAFAGGDTVVDETFKTTFSDYGQIGQMLTCSPGYMGGYATPDQLTLRGHAIELQYSISNEPFYASSYEALYKEGHHGGVSKRRPYNQGCKPAIEKFLKALEGQELVEVDVHHKVTNNMTIDSRVVRKRDGDVQQVKYFEVDYRTESFEFTLGGLEFNLFRTVNGASREK